MCVIQVTTKCNMSCAHCCLDRGNGQSGKNMQMDMFKGSCYCAENNTEWVTLGGGEPFMNPHIFKMIEHMLDNTELFVHIVTNGTMTKRMSKLFDLLESWYDTDRISIELSWDQFHDTHLVEPFVYNYFKRINKLRTCGDRPLIPAGRAIGLINEYEMSPHHKCACDTWQIMPTGKIMGCACHDSIQIGEIVHHGYELYQDKLIEDFEDEACYSTSRLSMV